MNELATGFPPSSCLQALLATPERQRTDAQRGKLNELEIALTAGNRAEAREPGVRLNALCIRRAAKTRRWRAIQRSNDCFEY